MSSRTRRKAARLALFPRPGLRRIFEIPLEPPDRARKYRARFLLIAIAQRYYVAEATPEKAVYRFCLLTGYVDAHLPHDRDSLRIERCFLASGAHNVETLTAQRAQEPLRHLRPARVAGAQQKNTGFNHVTAPYLQQTI